MFLPPMRKIPRRCNGRDAFDFIRAPSRIGKREKERERRREREFEPFDKSSERESGNGADGNEC